MKHHEERLTAPMLAVRIGPRRGGRPTMPATVRFWMSQGLYGQRLRYVDEVGVRLTTWAWYEEFRAAVARAKEEARGRRLAAAARALAGG